MPCRETSRSASRPAASGYLSKPIDIPRLLKTIADLLVLGPPEAAKRAPGGRGQALAAVSGPEGPLHSTLPGSDADFRDIVEDFKAWLDQHLQAMRKAWQNEQWPALTKLAHTLKGTGGSVGFACFSQPAFQVEQLARQQRTAGLAELLDVLDQMAARIALPAATN